MELKILNKENKEIGKIKLPVQFEEDVRIDLINKAFLVLRSHKRQPYGAKPDAGMNSSATIPKRRRKYRGSYGHGISRIPRKILSRRGTQMYWVGAFAPGTVGGRRAHPPKAEKNWELKINIKENRKAIRSAMAAVVNKEIVKQRNHKIPDNYPFIIDNDVENISKAKELQKILVLLGFKEELERAKEKKIRAGKGTMRGRPYKKKKSLLIVVGDDCDLMKIKSMPGIDIVKIKDINVELLAPGSMPGRVTLFTKNAIEKLEKEKLFL